MKQYLLVVTERTGLEANWHYSKLMDAKRAQQGELRCRNVTSAVLYTILNEGARK